jgi:hypothetical protein
MSRIYTIDGCEYPSVTTVLDTVSKGDRLLHWASDQACDYVAKNLGNGMSLPDLLDNARTNFLVKKDEACSIGSEVHHLIEQNIKGIWVDMRDLRREIAKGFLAFLSWKRAHRVQFLHTEMRIVNKRHAYAGTLDSIISYEGRLLVVDWKTSGSIYETYPLQIAGYREGAREMGIKTDGEAIVRLDKGTGAFEFQDYSKGHEKHLNAFLRLLDFWYAFRARRLKGNPRANGLDFKSKMVA